MGNLLKHQILLGVNVTNETEDDILDYVQDSLQKKDEKYFITTPNPEIITYATKHQKYRDILNQARIGLPDGVGVTLAGKLLGKPLKQRITGVDFMKNLCEKVAKKPVNVGFLGGRGNVALKTAECLRKMCPELKISFVGEVWDKDSEFRVRGSEFKTIDILFVAFGFPKQEEWMAEHLGKIPVKVMMGVGGAFDYLSGSIPRAPKLIRNFGLEWLVRLILQPWRIKRQLALVEFIFLVMRELRSGKESIV